LPGTGKGKKMENRRFLSEGKKTSAIFKIRGKIGKKETEIGITGEKKKKGFFLIKVEGKKGGLSEENLFKTCRE